MTDETLLEKIEEIVDKKLSNKIDPITTTLQAHSKDLVSIKRKLNKTAKLLTIITKQFDQRIVNNTKDIERINKHLNLH
jgi:hypothetical protein